MEGPRGSDALRPSQMEVREAVPELREGASGGPPVGGQTATWPSALDAYRRVHVLEVRVATHRSSNVIRR